MKGLDEFVKLFGNITVLQIVEFVLVCVFMLSIYKQVKKFFRQRVEEQIASEEKEKQRDAQIKEALDASHKYEEYRMQSIGIRQTVEAQIEELKNMHKDTTDRLDRMEEATRRRERNKTRDRLLQMYRYYTDTKNNPSQSWTEMESEAFWELFRDYEDAGGDGYMHTDVQPAMMKLFVIKQ